MSSGEDVLLQGRVPGAERRGLSHEPQVQHAKRSLVEHSPAVRERVVRLD
jgi:hypothetical protein